MAMDDRSSAGQRQRRGLQALQAVTRCIAHNHSLPALQNTRFTSENTPPTAADDDEFLKANALLQ
jgi:hypothetical protein